MGEGAAAAIVGAMEVGQLVTLTSRHGDCSAGARGQVLDIYGRADGDRAIVTFAGHLETVPLSLLAELATTERPPPVGATVDAARSG